jgi:hypothetical protein
MGDVAAAPDIDPIGDIGVVQPAIQRFDRAEAFDLLLTGGPAGDPFGAQRRQPRDGVPAAMASRRWWRPCCR